MIGLVAALALIAQDANRWSEATISPTFADGRLRGCALNFKSVQTDNLYFGGRAVGADGSFNVYHFGGAAVGAMLKVAVLDDGALRAPDTAYLVTGYATNAPDATSSVAAVDPGYTLTTFRFGESTGHAIGSIAERSVITVGVQMNGGSSAIPFRTDLTNEQGVAWADCVDALIQGIRAEIDQPQ